MTETNTKEYSSIRTMYAFAHDDDMLNALEAAGIYPKEIGGIKRTPYQEGWNDAVKHITLTYAKLLKAHAEDKQ